MKSRAELESRIAELEETLRKLVAAVERYPLQRSMGIDSALIDAKAALSTAPQASTEQCLHRVNSLGHCMQCGARPYDKPIHQASTEQASSSPAVVSLGEHERMVREFATRHHEVIGKLHDVRNASGNLLEAMRVSGTQTMPTVDKAIRDLKRELFPAMGAALIPASPSPAVGDDPVAAGLRERIEKADEAIARFQAQPAPGGTVRCTAIQYGRPCRLEVHHAGVCVFADPTPAEPQGWLADGLREAANVSTEMKAHVAAHPSGFLPAEPQGRPEQAGDRPVMMSELVKTLRDCGYAHVANRLEGK